MVGERKGKLELWALCREMEAAGDIKMRVSIREKLKTETRGLSFLALKNVDLERGRLWIRDTQQSPRLYRWEAKHQVSS